MSKNTGKKTMSERKAKENSYPFQFQIVGPNFHDGELYIRAISVRRGAKFVGSKVTGDFVKTNIGTEILVLEVEQGLVGPDETWFVIQGYMPQPWTYGESAFGCTQIRQVERRNSEFGQPWTDGTFLAKDEESLAEFVAGYEKLRRASNEILPKDRKDQGPFRRGGGPIYRF